MPHRPAAKKSLKQDEKRRRRNKGVKTRLHGQTREFKRALERQDVQKAEGQLQLLVKSLHQAAAKGVLHRNTARRRQSRLSRRFNEVKTASQTSV